VTLFTLLTPLTLLTDPLTVVTLLTPPILLTRISRTPLPTHNPTHHPTPTEPTTPTYPFLRGIERSDPHIEHSDSHTTPLRSIAVIHTLPSVASRVAAALLASGATPVSVCVCVRVSMCVCVCVYLRVCVLHCLKAGRHW
jgi:hypothetical protein